MRQGPIATVFLIIVGGTYLQVRGNGREVSANTAPTAGQTTTIAGIRGEGFIGVKSPAVPPPDSPALVSQTVVPIPPKKAHRVMLSWAPAAMTTVTTDDVIGYNVYRYSEFSDSWTKINSDLVAAPEFTDYHVRSGSTYYYTTTAVSQSGTQSGFSNMVKVVIPYP
jgi:hypothetical protein